MLIQNTKEYYKLYIARDIRLEGIASKLGRGDITCPMGKCFDPENHICPDIEEALNDNSYADAMMILKPSGVGL